MKHRKGHELMALPPHISVLYEGPALVAVVFLFRVAIPSDISTLPRYYSLNICMDFIKDFEVTKEEGSQVKMSGEIPFAELEKERSAAIKKLGANVKIDGFREGHVPEAMLVERLGEMSILGEMAERAIAKAYPAALKEHNIDAIGYPQIQITKIAADNPLGFTATIAVVPEVTLPDYKSIAKETNKDAESSEVTDEDVEKQINDILRQKVAYERLQTKAAAKAEAEKQQEDLGGVTELPTPESEAANAEEPETHVHADGTVHEGPAHPEPEAVDDKDLPELTDELVKTLGQPGQFENVEDFKTKLREHLTIEKERDVAAKNRAAVTEAIVAVSEVDMPKVLIDSEIHQMWAQMEGDLQQANMKMDEYLAHIKKTKEELIVEWTPHAEKRAKLQLVLNEIAKTEDIKPDENELKTQVDHLMSHYKDADESRVRVYVASMLVNEAVMKLLEEQK